MKCQLRPLGGRVKTVACYTCADAKVKCSFGFDWDAAEGQPTEVRSDAIDRMASAFERIASAMERHVALEEHRAKTDLRRLEMEANQAEAGRRQSKATEDIARDTYGLLEQVRDAVKEYLGEDESSGSEGEGKDGAKYRPETPPRKLQLRTMVVSNPSGYDPQMDPSRRLLSEDVELDYSAETPPEERTTDKGQGKETEVEDVEKENAGEADMDTAE